MHTDLVIPPPPRSSFSSSSSPFLLVLLCFEMVAQCVAQAVLNSWAQGILTACATVSSLVIKPPWWSYLTLMTSQGLTTKHQSQNQSPSSEPHSMNSRTLTSYPAHRRFCTHSQVQGQGHRITSTPPRPTEKSWAIHKNTRKEIKKKKHPFARVSNNEQQETTDSSKKE